MAVEGIIVDAIVERTFNEDRPQTTRDHFRRGDFPHAFVAWFQCERVWLDIAENYDLAPCGSVADEEGGAFDCCVTRSEILAVVVCCVCDV